MARAKQKSMLKTCTSAYGGDLLTTRKGRSRGRPLSTRETMHLVLRSTQAKGAMSFLRPQNDSKVRRIIAKFSAKYGVTVLSLANVGNHLHLHLKLGSRFTFNSFIRAVTGAIAMAVTGRNRWRSVSGPRPQNITSTSENFTSTSAGKFWDRRPFTRIVKSFRARQNMHDYIRINEMEGWGHTRANARFMVEIEKNFARLE